MRLAAAVLTLLLLPVSAAAAEPPAALDEPHRIDFGLGFSRAQSTLDYGGAKISTTVRWISVSWHEPFGERLRLGFHGGYTTMSQTSNPVTVGTSLSGSHAGISADVTLLRWTHARLYAGARYTYQQADGATTDQATEMEWNQTRAELGAVVRVAQSLRVFGGVDRGRIDGEERTSGTINRTRPFLADETGVFGGLSVLDSTAGSVSIVWRSGIESTVGFAFRRQF